MKNGGGYPVALAEAHEQAVVKGPDREFFYHFLQKMGMERSHAQSISRKSLRKTWNGDLIKQENVCDHVL